MLTQRQRDALDFIEAQIAETGVAPSYQELADGLGLSSKANVHRVILCLEERGFIRRLPNHARAIEVVDHGEADEQTTVAFWRAQARHFARLSETRLREIESLRADLAQLKKRAA